MVRKNIKKSKLNLDENIRLMNDSSVSTYYTAIPDVEKLYIDPMTQIFIGCRIGVDIKIDNKWIYISKEKIDDHLDLYNEDSDFFPIKEKIKNYQHKDILIGSDNCDQRRKVAFYVCTTTKARKLMLEFEVKMQEIAKRKTLDLLHRSIGSWVSLGSEEEINEQMILLNRSLFLLKFIAELPVLKQKTTFQMRFAQETNTGYVECLPARVLINLVYRKRINNATQSTSFIKHQETQNNILIFRNKAFQCPGKYRQIKLNKKLEVKLLNFFQTNYSDLSETLVTNNYLNLHSNDYKILGNFSKLTAAPVELKSFQDVIRCKLKKVSCVAWNALISGVIAVAYIPSSFFCKSQRKHTLDFTNNDSEDCIVLIWEYKNNLHPKLYLHATRNVTALSFCPYNENILVGGYSNGQIVVWDLMNKLTVSEPRKFYTHAEVRNQTLIAQQTKWIRKSLDSNHMYPVLTSEIGIGHNSQISSVAWIPSNYYMTNGGIYMECKNQETYMQFISGSESGTELLLWDLSVSQILEKTMQQRKIRRLVQTPKALRVEVSPLVHIQKYFKPVYTLFLGSTTNKRYSPLTKIIFKNDAYYYVVLNPNTFTDIDSTSHFEVLRLLHSFDYTQKITLATGLGILRTATWKEAETKKSVFTECKLQNGVHVHDGPIVVCEINSFFPDILLTIGGTVFAIWDCRKIQFALAWRKNKHRYLSGMWSFLHPLSILLLRGDRHFEFWNLMEISNTPINVFKCKGCDTLQLYGDTNRSHARKNTFVITDEAGATRLFTVPSKRIKQNDANIFESLVYLNNVFKLKQYIKALKNSCRKYSETNIVDEEIIANKTNTILKVQATSSSIPNHTEVLHEKTKIIKVKISAVDEWKLKLQRHARKVFFELKRINLAELEHNFNKYIGCHNRSKVYLKERIKRIHAVVAFNATKEKILTGAFPRTSRNRFTVAYPKEIETTMKKMYTESFQEIEQEMIKIIKSKMIQ